MLCHAMLCYDMLCYAMLCYATLCYATLRYDMLCYAMLCYAMRCTGSPADANAPLGSRVSTPEPLSICPRPSDETPPHLAHSTYMLCHAMPRYATLCYADWHAMPCYAAAPAHQRLLDLRAAAVQGPGPMHGRGVVGVGVGRPFGRLLLDAELGRRRLGGGAQAVEVARDSLRGGVCVRLGCPTAETACRARGACSHEQQQQQGGEKGSAQVTDHRGWVAQQQDEPHLA